MKKLTLFVSALLLFWAVGASAHGPVRQKLVEKIVINAEPSAVWDVIKNFGDMSWLPAVAKTESEGGDKKGATRVLTMKDGGTINEELKSYSAKKMSYKYKITDMSNVKMIQHSGEDVAIKVLRVDNYSATITVKAKGEDSEVIWKTAFYRAYLNNNPPEELNEAAAKAAVKAVIIPGLENLKKVVEAK